MVGKGRKKCEERKWGRGWGKKIEGTDLDIACFDNGWSHLCIAITLVLFPPTLRGLFHAKVDYCGIVNCIEDVITPKLHSRGCNMTAEVVIQSVEQRFFRADRAENSISEIALLI